MKTILKTYSAKEFSAKVFAFPYLLVNELIPLSGKDCVVVV
jgi:hypothetical protein